METSSWTPVLAAADRRRVLPVLDAIATALSDTHLVRFWGPSWSSGAAGIALFFWYLSKETNEAKWREQAHALLQQSVELATRRAVGPALFAGTPGIAWTVAHLSHECCAVNASDLQLAADDLLLQRIDDMPRTGEYDLMRGLVGDGVYALTRQSHPNGQVLLSRIVDRLAETAITFRDGIAWPAGPAGSHIDLGLAHGVPGVIALLGYACETGVNTQVARRLLDRSVAWLLAQRNPDSADSCFGIRASIDGSHRDPSPSRVAWCYGDLSIATALYSAARSVNREDWELVALDVATRAAGRPLEGSGVKDAQLCHGAAGNAHIFNRLYQATRDRPFLDAARLWFERTLGFYEPGTGCGGFQFWTEMTGPADALRRTAPGLLQGAAGVGLALLAAISAIEPEWDTLLLVTMSPDSFKPRPHRGSPSSRAPMHVMEKLPPR